MKGNSFANGTNSNGPLAPGKREQYGMPPRPVTIYNLNDEATPE